MKERAGKYVLVPNLDYRAFEPIKLQDLSLEITNEISIKLGRANRLLGKLDGLSLKIPNINLFISSYVRKEALMSSQIEGTQTSLVDVLDPNIDSNSNSDVLDVVNYTKALNYAINRLEVLPLCNKLLKETHAVLLKGTRGEEKCPGEFRRSQNWIGPAGSDLSNAKYIPPTVDFMLEAMSDFEKYMNDENIVLDPIIKSALIHYQFETIHPFLDGNGRIGRMLIVLYLLNQEIITYPVFYISYFLKKNRVEYYDRLAEVRSKGNYEQWVAFFLDAVIETCKDSIQTIEELTALNEKNILKLGRVSKSTRAVFEYVTKNPIIDINKTAKELDLSFNTVSKAVSALVNLGILKEETSNKRNRIFNYEEYLNILKRDTENM